MLLVDDRQAQLVELDRLLNQRVRADDQLRVALRDVMAQSASCAPAPAIR